MTPHVIFIPFIFALGACIGSFLNVVVWRLPRGESLVNPPSHCPKCNKRLRWYDNLPVIGWIKLGGRCRDCRRFRHRTRAFGRGAPIRKRTSVGWRETIVTLSAAIAEHNARHGGGLLPGAPRAAETPRHQPHAAEVAQLQSFRRVRQRHHAATQSDADVIDLRVARALRRLEPRKVLAEVTRNERRTVQEREQIR